MSETSIHASNEVIAAALEFELSAYTATETIDTTVQVTSSEAAFFSDGIAAVEESLEVLCSASIRTHTMASAPVTISSSWYDC